MNTYQAMALAALVITSTGALAIGTAAAVAAVHDLAQARLFRARLGLGPRALPLSYKRNGGLHFVKAGRYGAALWVSRRAPAPQTGSIRVRMNVTPCK